MTKRSIHPSITELIPCPFCGIDAASLVGPYPYVRWGNDEPEPNYIKMHVVCAGCFARGPEIGGPLSDGADNLKEFCRMMWNQRATKDTGLHKIFGAKYEISQG